MSQEELRQPIVVVLGHVDSGKTSLLDKIRGTAVQAREHGGITQHIGASFFPLDLLKEICGPTLGKNVQIKIPGLLVIDTPGHEVFSNLRSRGGSAADIAILVVDIMKGFEQQTYESVEILKKKKVPFVVALNKLDTLPGWKTTSKKSLSEELQRMDKAVSNILDTKIYDVVGALSRAGFVSEAFFRVKNFTKEIGIVPASAKTGQGIPELISVLVGLTQQYLARKLIAKRDSAKGIVLEVKEEPGLGQTANIILIDGILRTHSNIVSAKKDGAVVMKVKAMFMPKPLDEMRDPRDRFTPVEQVVAAAGVKITTPDLEGTLPGSPIIGISEDESPQNAIEQVNSEIKGVFVETDQLGVVVKSDAIGSLEAIVEILKGKKVQIRRADIGPVSRRDVVEASLVAGDDRYLGVILAFGIKIFDDAKDEALAKGVRIFSDQVIYSLIDTYTDWVEKEKEAESKAELSQITYPCKFKLMKGMVFRRSNPAVFGVEILSGKLQKKAVVINSKGEKVGEIEQIQDKNTSLQEAVAGSEVAVSMDKVIIGRTILEGETLFTLPADKHVRILREKYKDVMAPDELKTFEEILDLRRKVAPLYGF
ncbi:MAG: translation initiation factor IF-2 [Thaumarchaeota archaeon]|nr:translation initiation factor IF-2 [Nitrososphaerota archaeon]